MIMAMHDLINAICVHKLDDMQVGLHVMLGRTMLHTAACAPRACICKCNYCDMSQYMYAQDMSHDNEHTRVCTGSLMVKELNTWPVIQQCFTVRCTAKQAVPL